METIKEEKKAGLEQLLNSLIEKGWKPFGESRIDEINRAEQYAGNTDIVVNFTDDPRDVLEYIAKNFFDDQEAELISITRL